MNKKLPGFYYLERYRNKGTRTYSTENLPEALLMYKAMGQKIGEMFSEIFEDITEFVEGQDNEEQDEKINYDNRSVRMFNS